MPLWPTLISDQFHDDGEKELGHTVATLSLGAPSVMSFRPKKRSGLKMFGRQGGKDGTYPAIIKFACRHGDYVVMHGRGIHALYEVRQRIYRRLADQVLLTTISTRLYPRVAVATLSLVDPSSQRASRILRSVRCPLRGERCQTVQSTLSSTVKCPGTCCVNTSKSLARSYHISASCGPSTRRTSLVSLVSTEGLPRVRHIPACQLSGGGNGW